MNFIHLKKKNRYLTIRQAYIKKNRDSSYQEIYEFVYKRFMNRISTPIKEKIYAVTNSYSNYRWTAYERFATYYTVVVDFLEELYKNETNHKRKELSIERDLINIGSLYIPFDIYSTYQMKYEYGVWNAYLRKEQEFICTFHEKI